VKAIAASSPAELELPASDLRSARPPGPDVLMFTSARAPPRARHARLPPARHRRQFCQFDGAPTSVIRVRSGGRSPLRSPQSLTLPGIRVRQTSVKIHPT